MLREMMNPKCHGQTVRINLSKWGYRNYIVECAYYYDRNKDKYRLTMWINRRDLEDRMQVSSKKVDAQYIPGTEETIIEHICRVVHQGCLCGYFDYFIERYKYELACFERGNELFEAERLNLIHSTEKTKGTEVTVH